MIIYKTTNLINGKFYIGKDGFNNPNYLGSGTYLKYAINKYGRENFKKEVIEECDGGNWEERERFWIEKTGSKNNNIGYNICDGGEGGPILKGVNHPQFGKKKSDYQREIARLANIGNKNHLGKKHSPEALAKMSQARPGITGENNPFYGKKHSEETRAKMSMAAKTRKRSEQHKLNMSLAMKGRLSPMLGKHHSKESNAKRSESLKRFYANKRSLTCQQ